MIYRALSIAWTIIHHNREFLRCAKQPCFGCSNLQAGKLISPEITRGSITGQVKALAMIVAIEGHIPDRRARGASPLRAAQEPTRPCHSLRAVSDRLDPRAAGKNQNPPRARPTRSRARRGGALPTPKPEPARWQTGPSPWEVSLGRRHSLLRNHALGGLSDRIRNCSRHQAVVSETEPLEAPLSVLTLQLAQKG